MSRSYKRWTEEEDLILIGWSTMENCSQIAIRLNRSKSSVRYRFYALKTKKKRVYCNRSWTKSDLTHLRKSYSNNSSLKRTARCLGKSVNAVKSKATREGLTRRRKNPKWSVSEIDIMQKLVAEGKSWDEISKVLKRTKNACRKKASENGITRGEKKEWRMSELNILHQHRCEGFSYKEISNLLSRSEASIRKRYARYKKEEIRCFD